MNSKLESIYKIVDRIEEDLTKITDAVDAANENGRVTLEKKRMYFPIEWEFADDNGLGGPPVKDPNIMFVERDEEEEYHWFSLAESIDDLIEGYENPDKKIDSPEHIKTTKAVANNLRELADKLDKAIEPDSSKHRTE